jgi:DNA mismatch endonuclease (patch repair protein)
MKPTDPGYPRPSSEAVSNAMRGNRKTGSRPEASLRRELHARGLRYRKNPSLRTSVGVVRPDLTFAGPKVAVFVDGCFWHSCPLHGTTPGTNRDYWKPKLRRNRERDRLVTAALIAEGWVVIRVWEHEPLARAAAAVEMAVRSKTLHSNSD